MKPCIVVKQKKFQHQPVYTGNGSEIRCHFCGQTWASLKVYWEELTFQNFLGEGI